MRIVNVAIERKVIFFFLILSSLSGYSQSVKKQSKNINSRNYPGFSVTLQGSESKITSFWEDHITDKSKLRKKRDFWQLEEFRLPDAYYPEAVYYVRLLPKESTVIVWIALDPETLLAGDEGEGLVALALESFMVEVPLAYDRFEINLKISDAEQAVNFQVRHQESLKQQNVRFGQQLEYSKEERIRMKKLLENLELEILATAQRIENNNVAMQQDSLDIERMRNLIIKYRQELAKIE